MRTIGFFPVCQAAVCWSFVLQRQWSCRICCIKCWKKSIQKFMQRTKNNTFWKNNDKITQPKKKKEGGEDRRTERVSRESRAKNKLDTSWRWGWKELTGCNIFKAHIFHWRQMERELEYEYKREKPALAKIGCCQRDYLRSQKHEATHSLVFDRSKVNVCMSTRCRLLPTAGSFSRTSRMPVREKKKKQGDALKRSQQLTFTSRQPLGLKTQHWPSV